MLNSGNTAARFAKILILVLAVAISACEQSGRARLPTVNCYPSLTQAIEQDEAKLRLLLHFDGPPLTGHLHNQPGSLSILTGAEGGLSTQEIGVAKTHGYHAAAIGPRVLRFETAAITALALAQAQAGDLNASDFAQTKAEEKFIYERSREGNYTLSFF